MDYSVIIAKSERDQALAALLSSIVGQFAPAHGRYEIIVANNGRQADAVQRIENVGVACCLNSKRPVRSCSICSVPYWRWGGIGRFAEFENVTAQKGVTIITGQCYS